MVINETSNTQTQTQHLQLTTDKIGAYRIQVIKNEQQLIVD